MVVSQHSKVCVEPSLLQASRSRYYADSNRQYKKRLQFGERGITEMLILIIVLVLVFGVGGGYYGYGRWGTGGGAGIGLGTVLVIVLACYMLGLFR
jgi:hypothetical protein